MEASLHLPLNSLAAHRAETFAQRTESADVAAKHQVATDFESMFVSLMLKEMRKTVGESGLFGGDSSDVYGGLFDMFMSQHIAESGGLGIGKMIATYLDVAKNEPGNSN